MKKCILIVIDSLGCGDAPDAEEYNKIGSNTISNVSYEVNGLELPYLDQLGLGKVTEIEGFKNLETKASYGKLTPKSVNNDSTTGHWELAGVVSSEPFSLYPEGFPSEIVEEVEKGTGQKFIGNKHASGTEIINELGKEHLETNKLILYTSGDSVFQIAAHENVISVQDLHNVCSIARKLLNKYRIGRVIARPFIGDIDSFERTYERKDFGMQPPDGNILQLLLNSHYKTYGIGKIKDLMGTDYLTQYKHTEGDEDGMKELIHSIINDEFDFTFINLVDCDMLYGHREDPGGYAKGLILIDKYIGEILSMVSNDDLILITGDHGNDPTDGNTDHTREYVPILAYTNKEISNNLGTRSSFTDVAKTIAEYFNIENKIDGTSFLYELNNVQ